MKGLRTLVFTRTIAFIFATLATHGFANEAVYLKASPINAEKSIGLLQSEKTEFNPSRKENYKVEFAVEQLSEIELTLYSADGDVIRTLISGKEFVTGNHSTVWDGLDDEGQVAPDEAYVPVIEITTTASTVIDDPRRYSGGEIIPNIEWALGNNTELSFQLDYPARVLVRTGIQDGPMMRVLKHWEPIIPGKTVIRWDGYDKDGVESFAGRDDVWFVVMAYRIPEYSVITTGNQETDYLSYRKAKGWVTPVPDLTQIELQRNGIRLEQDYFLPRAYSPEVILELAEGGKPSRVGMPVIEDSALFRIDVPEHDRWILDTTFYETSFYIDFKFQSEEEQGFVPLIWEYDASALEPGRHIATVQLFGFGGFISSDTVEFLIAP